jgi:leader peptidase (prepilin peptidase) / N-methyltransferase
MIPTIFYISSTFILGLLIGSFLNVCIHRIPKELSIINPPSSCPTCKKRIAWYDNIPILSFIILRGKCRNCGEKISWRYPLVEAMSGILAALLVYKFGPTVEFAVLYIFCASLIVISMIDLQYQIIPNEISISGIILGFIYSFFSPVFTWQASLLGILVGGGILALIALIYYFLMKSEGMGGGDIKLLAMIGAFLGVGGVVFTLAIGSIVGSVIGIILMLKDKGDSKAKIPFGPFLSLGALGYIFFGGLLFDTYLGLLW